MMEREEQAMNSHKKELEAILTLAEAAYERLSNDISMRMELGFGQSDAPEPERSNFRELYDDLCYLRGAICVLERCRKGDE